jgi:hypothetical protein
MPVIAERMSGNVSTMAILRWMGRSFKKRKPRAISAITWQIEKPRISFHQARSPAPEHRDL